MTNNNNSAKNIDTEMVTELQLYAVNTRYLYELAMYTCKNMARKINDNIYDEQKALKAFYNLACEVVKAYNAEFKVYDKWYQLATTDTRRELAKELMSYYQEYIDEQDKLLARSSKRK